MHETFKDRVDFVLIYTMEAHAMDEWPICNAEATFDGEAVMVAQHKMMRDRLNEAKKFARNYEIPFTVLVDNMQNTFEEEFACWPTRSYLIHKQQLIYKEQPTGVELSEFSLDPLEIALQQLLDSQN